MWILNILIGFDDVVFQITFDHSNHSDKYLFRHKNGFNDQNCERKNKEAIYNKSSSMK